MRCQNCSTENSEDSKFCMACGSSLSQPTPEPAPPAVQAPPPAETPVDQPVTPPPPPVVSEPAPPAPDWSATPPAPPVSDPPPAADNPWLAADQVPGPEPATAAVAPAPPDAAVPPAPPGEAPTPPVEVDGIPPVPETGPDAAPVPGAPGPADPHGLEAHVARISDTTRPFVEAPLLVAATLLDPEETVAVVVPGLIDEVVGIAIVTDRRVLLVDTRRWNPRVTEVAIEPELRVDGWQDADSAMLTFVSDDTVRISGIVDKPLAFEAARIVRESVAGR